MEKTIQEKLDSLQNLSETVSCFLEELDTGEFDTGEFDFELSMAYRAWDECENWILQKHQSEIMKKKMDGLTKNLMYSILEDCDNIPSC